MSLSPSVGVGVAFDVTAAVWPCDVPTAVEQYVQAKFGYYTSTVSGTPLFQVSSASSATCNICVRNRFYTTINSTGVYL